MENNNGIDDLTYHLLLADMIAKDPTLQTQLKVVKSMQNDGVACKNTEAAASQKLRDLINKCKSAIFLIF